MKIFISWSGASSRLVAEALSDWLQRVIQAIKPFYSHDIDKGAKWSNEVDAALEGTRFGIICLTPDNLESSWIHYEAGALSKTKDASIWTFLLELKPSDVKQPLGRFQHTLAEKADVLKMLKSINIKLVEINGESLRENLLEEIFEESWAKLEMRLNNAKETIIIQSKDENSKVIESGRNQGDKLDEILEILRSQQRKTSIPKLLLRGENILEEIHKSPKQNTQLFSNISFLLSPKYSDFQIDSTRNALSKTFGASEIHIFEVDDTYKVNVKFEESLTIYSISEKLRMLKDLTLGEIQEISLTPNL